MGAGERPAVLRNMLLKKAVEWDVIERMPCALRCWIDKVRLKPDTTSAKRVEKCGDDECHVRHLQFLV